MTAHLRQLRAQVEQLGKLADDISWSANQRRTVGTMMKDIRKTMAWIESPPPAPKEKHQCPHCRD